jgi:hypothetical protein
MTHQFSYFPYFPSKDFEAKISRLHLFNFWHFKDQYIPDPSVRGKMEQICSLYVDSNLERIDEPTIAVIDDNYSFAYLTEEQIKDIQRYALALLFCSITENDKHRAYTSEHFQLYRQNFSLTEDNIAYKTGSYSRVTVWESFDDAKLLRPSYVQTNAFQYRFDDKLFMAFANMIDAHNDEDDRIFKALEWVKHSFINAEEVPYESRPVLMATAFEVLFDLPDFKKSDELANRLEALLRVTGLPVIRKPNSFGKEKENTVYGWWARDFYDLRSKIVHGSSVTTQDFGNHNNVEHLKIAVMVMNFCLYRLLEDRGYLVYKEPAPELRSVLKDFNYDKYSTERDLREVEALIN